MASGAKNYQNLGDENQPKMTFFSPNCDNNHQPVSPIVEIVSESTSSDQGFSDQDAYLNIRSLD